MAHKAGEPCRRLRSNGTQWVSAPGPAWSLLSFYQTYCKFGEGSVHPRASFLKQISLPESLGQEGGQVNIYL